MIDSVDAAFAYAAPYTGLPKDHVKLVTILYTVVPLCAVLKRLPDNKPYLKNIFNIRHYRSMDFLILVSRCLFWSVSMTCGLDYGSY
jgi:hypothetical protein